MLVKPIYCLLFYYYALKKIIALQNIHTLDR